MCACVPSLASSVCWRGTEDVIAGLETACLHTSSVYTSGSHSSVVSSLSEAGGKASPTVAYGRSMAHFHRCSLIHIMPCLLLVIGHSIFFDADKFDCMDCGSLKASSSCRHEKICHHFYVDAYIHSQVICYIPDSISYWVQYVFSIHIYG